MQEFKNEFITGMAAEKYHAIEGIGSTAISHMADSMHAYDYFKNNPENPSKSMNLGTMVHYFILEPKKFKELYAVPPDIKNYPDALKGNDELKAKCKELGLKLSGTKVQLQERIRQVEPTAQFWEEILEEQMRGKIPITDKEIKMLIGLEKSLSKMPFAKKLLAQGVPEVSGFWYDEEFDVIGKMRVDWITENGYLIDFKTSNSSSTRQWQNKLVEYRYDIQTAWYWRGYKAIKGEEPKGFIHIVAETNEPHNLRVYLASPVLLHTGEFGGQDTKGFRECLEEYNKCKLENYWPMSQDDVIVETMPGWFLGEYDGN